MPETLSWKLDADQFRSWHIASFRCDAEFGRYRSMADIGQAAPINLNWMSTRPGSAAHRHPQSFHWYTSPGRAGQFETIAFEADLALV